MLSPSAAGQNFSPGNGAGNDAGLFPPRSSKCDPASWARSQRGLVDLPFSEAVEGQQVGKENKVGTDEATASWVMAAFSLRRVRLRYGDALSLGAPASDQDLEFWRGNGAQSDHIETNASLGNLA